MSYIVLGSAFITSDLFEIMILLFITKTKQQERKPNKWKTQTKIATICAKMISEMRVADVIFSNY